MTNLRECEMTEQDIIDAAHKAGLTHYIEQHGQFLIRLAKFAQLIQQRGSDKVDDQARGK